MFWRTSEKELCFFVRLCKERRVVAGMTKPLFERKREELTVSIRTPSGSVPATLFGAWRETCTYPERVVPALFARSNVQSSQPAVRLTARTYYGKNIWFGNVPWVRPELKVSVEHLIHSNKHGLEVCLEVIWERGGGWSRSKEVAQEATHLEGEDQLYVG